MRDEPTGGSGGRKPAERGAGTAGGLIVPAAYLLLGLLLTWPLAMHFGTHVPGDGIDDPSLAWNLWWAKHALVDQPQNPFACRWQFWPVGINLAFYTLTLLNGMLSIPLQAVFGTVPAYNVLLLSSFVLSGVGAYLLCREFLGLSRRLSVLPSRAGPLIGGALYAFASSKLFYAALGQGNIASSQWAPFAALYLVRMARPAGRCSGVRDAALAALFLALQAYAELTFASFLLIFAALAFLWGVARTEVTGTSQVPVTLLAMRTRLLARFSLFAVLCILALAPFLANMLPDLMAEGDFFTAGGGFADVFSADLAGYAFPTQLHPVLGGVIRDLAQNASAQAGGPGWPVDKGQHVYVGYTALALAACGLWAGRRRPGTWFWAAAAFVFFLLTLGPSLRVAGRDLGVPLPFAVLERLPFFKGNRYPSRYSVMLLLSLAPLVAAGVSRLTSRPVKVVSTLAQPPRRAPVAIRSTQYAVPILLSVLPLLLLFEHLSLPLPLSDLRVPVIYDRVADAPGDFALLELPLGWRNGARVAGKQDVVIMAQLWYQTHHGKRLLGGNTSRNPEFKFQYFSEDPTLARLIALTNAADLPQHDALRAALLAAPVGEADLVQARDWAAFNNVRYVMVHRDKLPPEAEAAVRALLPLKAVAEEGNLALYEVAPAAQPPQTYEVGTDAGRMALAEGWSPPMMGEPAAAEAAPPVYAQRRETRLLLPLGPDVGRLRLQMWALAPGQRVTLELNGRAAGIQALSEAPVELVFDLPADPARPPLSDVRLRFSAMAPVSAWPQRQHGPAALLVRSAGQEVGDFGHIYVEGIERSLNRRGYNLVALRGDGQVLDAASFDTHADAAAGAALAGWIATLPSGAIVAGAVRDEASLNLGPEAVSALRSLGVVSDLRGHFRWGQAFVGAAGAAPGTARESLDGMRPAQVAEGLPLSEPSLAAALTRVTFGK